MFLYNWLITYTVKNEKSKPKKIGSALIEKNDITTFFNICLNDGNDG